MLNFAHTHKSLFLSLSLSFNVPVSGPSFGCIQPTELRYKFIANGRVISAGAQRHSIMVCIINANWLCGHTFLLLTQRRRWWSMVWRLLKPNGPCFWKYTARTDEKYTEWLVLAHLLFSFFRWFRCCSAIRVFTMGYVCVAFRILNEWKFVQFALPTSVWKHTNSLKWDSLYDQRQQ